MIMNQIEKMEIVLYLHDRFFYLPDLSKVLPNSCTMLLKGFFIIFLKKFL